MSNMVLAVIVMFLFVFTFLSLCWIFVSSYRFTELIEGYLNRSKFVANNRMTLSNAGFIGLILRNCSMAMMFLIPQLCESRGLVEKNELANLPVHLKRMLVAPWIAGGVMFVLTLFFGFLLFD
jgi:hypothetical protein